MQFALLIYEAPEAFAARKSDGTDPYTGAWRAYYKSLVEAGVYIGGDPLEAPETGTTVRIRDGKRRVQDGPNPDAKEQLGAAVSSHASGFCGRPSRGQTFNQMWPPAIFISRWTPKILFSLKERPHRHGELRRHVGNVSQRMLTRTLRNLESRGLIARRETRAKAVAVEYSLTQLGRTIIAPLRGMCRWAKRYGNEVSAGVHLPEAYEAQ